MWLNLRKIGFSLAYVAIAIYAVHLVWQMTGKPPATSPFYHLFMPFVWASIVCVGLYFLGRLIGAAPAPEQG